MIEADRDGIQPVRVEADQRGVVAIGNDGPLAERNGRNAGVMGHRLRDDVDRIGVVEEPRARAHRLHVLDDAAHDVNGAQRHEEAARTLRLLADDAVLERDRLVEVARLKAPNPEARQHRVAARQTLAPVGGGGDGQVQAACACHFLRDGLHDAQTVLVEIDQHDL